MKIENIAKIFVFCCFTMLACGIKLKAQSSWDTLPWKSFADYRLQQLDKNYVTTGILYDRVFPIANVDEYNGRPNSNDTTSPKHFLQAYYEIFNASYNNTSFITPENLNNLLDTPYYNAHPIGIFYYKFNTLDTNALQDHLIDTLPNGQFIDVANRPRSPYFTNTSFLACPLLAEDQVLDEGEHVFYIDEQFFLHNEYFNIREIRIDFGDGQGEWITNNPFNTGAQRMQTGIISNGIGKINYC